jgi:hypothetical protein
MSVQDFSDEELDKRTSLAARLAMNCTDPKTQPAFNAAFQKLLDEQVRRDLLKVERKT